MHPKQLHFVTINSYLSLWHWFTVTPLLTYLLLFRCLLCGISPPALHAFILTVIWTNAASGSACLHDVSLTTATVVTFVFLVHEVIQQKDSMQSEYLQSESASLQV